jgi:parvulin-like peptidyl-prolyl isomerase
MGNGAVGLALFLFAGAMPAASGEDLPFIDHRDNFVVLYANSAALSRREVERFLDSELVRGLRRESLQHAGRWTEGEWRGFEKRCSDVWDQAQRFALRNLLLLQAARRIKLDEREFKKQLEERQRFWLESMREQAQKTGQKVSMSEQDIRRKVEEQFRLEIFDSHLAGTPSAAEIEEYYRGHPAEFQRPAAVKLRLIRLDLDNPALREKGADGFELAQRVQKEAREGRDFEALAREHSHDAETRARGGLLLGPGEDPFLDPTLYPLYEPRIKSLNPGGISEVFPIPNLRAYGILQLVERREAGLRPLDETLRQAIGVFIRNRARDAKRESLLREEWENSRIEQPDGKPVPAELLFPTAPALRPSAAKAPATSPAAEGGTP